MAFKPKKRLSPAGAAFCEVTRDSLEALRSRLVVVRYSNLYIIRRGFVLLAAPSSGNCSRSDGEVREWEMMHAYKMMLETARKCGGVSNLPPNIIPYLQQPTGAARS